MTLPLSACAVAVTPESVLFHDDDHPAIDTRRFEAAIGSGRLQPVSLRHSDGVTTQGVHLIKSGSRAVIVYLSGNKMRLADRGPVLLPRFAMLDADLFWLDYRGLGASEGQPSLETLQSDTFDLLALASRERKPIVLHGLSMGSLLAGRMARDPRVAALVLEGAIPTISDVAQATTPGWLRPLVEVKVDSQLAAYDNLASISSFDRPLLLLVGSNDTDTPPVLSRRLYEAAKSPSKKLVEVPDRAHDNAMTSNDAITAYRVLLASVH